MSGLDAFVTVPFQCSWGQYQLSGFDAFVTVHFLMELGSESSEWFGCLCVCTLSGGIGIRIK